MVASLHLGNFLNFFYLLRMAAERKTLTRDELEGSIKKLRAQKHADIIAIKHKYSIELDALKKAIKVIPVEAMTVKKWIVLTDNRILESNVSIHPAYLTKLSTEQIKSWILMEKDVCDYQDWFPFTLFSDGIRLHCVYININKSSILFGKFYRLVTRIFGKGVAEFVPELISE